MEVLRQRAANVAYGSKSEVGGRNREVRFTLAPDIVAARSAMSERCQKRSLVRRPQPVKSAQSSQPTPNQISKKEIVTTDMPVETTTAGDTVLEYTLYC